MSLFLDEEKANQLITTLPFYAIKKSIEVIPQYISILIDIMTKKDYAIKSRVGNPNFAFVMNMVKADDLRKMSKEEILDIYDNMEDYERALQRCEPYEMAKEWVRDQTKRLAIAREWLQKKDPTLFFQDPEESDDDN